MKITPSTISYMPGASSHHYDEDTYLNELFEECKRAAIRLTIQSGIMVRVAIRPVNGYTQFPTAVAPIPAPIPGSEDHEIVFKAMGQTFSNLKEVRKYLKLKAFL